MTTQRDVDRILRAWLDLMPDEAPDRTVAAVLQAVETAPQARRPLVFGPRRSTSMTRFALIAAAAALGVALLGGALLVGGDRPQTPAPTVVPAPSAAAPVPAPAALLANWLADAPTTEVFGTIDGPLRFIVSIGGQQAWVQAPDGTTSLRSTVEAVRPDELALRLTRAAGLGCAEGTVGRYRWDMADDRATMTLTAIEDPCAPRSEAISRTWARTHTGFSDGGSAVVPGAGPLFQVTLPAGSYTTRPLTDAQEIYDQARDYILYAWKNPQAFVDPCSTEERHEWKQGAAAFLDALKRNPALENFTTEETVIGGHPALHVQFNASSDHPRCIPDHAFYEWVPRDDPAGYWWLSAGDKDGLYLVDHPDATMMFQVLPIGDASEEEVIASIRFLDGLPTAP